MDLDQISEGGAPNPARRAEQLAYAGTLAGGFPDPARVALGLQEVLINAVEHGNLGIGYTAKTPLVVADHWHDEVMRRLDLPEHRDKTVEARFERRRETVEVTIRDQGPGFNWVKYLDFDPARAFDPHGRGIAMARTLCFDSLDYLGNGNAVMVAVNL